MRGAADIVYRRIEPQLSEYMGAVFEEICKQYLWKLLLDGNSPVEFSELGRWWGNDPIEKKQTEIDIMGEQDKQTALFGECKWTNEKVDLGVLETCLLYTSLSEHLYGIWNSVYNYAIENKIAITKVRNEYFEKYFSSLKNEKRQEELL